MKTNSQSISITPCFKSIVEVPTRTIIALKVPIMVQAAMMSRMAQGNSSKTHHHIRKLSKVKYKSFPMKVKKKA
jgi:hypothetical protein